MNKFIITACFCCCIFLSSLAQHTFSIVAVDTVTGEVGGAGASCISGNISVNIINGLIPGRAAMNAQAWVCIPNVNLQNGIAWLQQGLSPQQTLDSLLAKDACSAQNYNPAYRQYGIVDFDSSGKLRSVAYTGDSADDWKGHLTGVNYAAQGNILLGAQVLDSIGWRFLNTSGGLARRLMAALQGANFPGADSRCLLDSTSSTSAFIRVARPCDAPNKFWLNLDVPVLPKGREPIDSLKTLFDQFENTFDTCLLLQSAFIKSADTVDITGGGKTIFFTNNSQFAETYKWYVDSVLIDSAEHSSYFFDIPGVHTVTLVAIRGVGCCKDNGCCNASASSQVVVFGTSGNKVLSSSLAGVFVFPVPAGDFVYLNFPDGESRSHRFMISDVTGRKVRVGFVSGERITAYAGDLEKGIYLLTLEGEKRLYQTIFLKTEF